MARFNYTGQVYWFSRLFDYSLIVYDEVESFQDYNSLIYMYPYEQRKNVISTFTFDIQSVFTNAANY